MFVPFLHIKSILSEDNNKLYYSRLIVPYLLSDMYPSKMNVQQHNGVTCEGVGTAPSAAQTQTEPQIHNQLLFIEGNTAQTMYILSPSLFRTSRLTHILSPTKSEGVLQQLLKHRLMSRKGIIQKMGSSLSSLFCKFSIKVM